MLRIKQQRGTKQDSRPHTELRHVHAGLYFLSDDGLPDLAHISVAFARQEIKNIRTAVFGFSEPISSVVRGGQYESTKCS